MAKPKKTIQVQELKEMLNEVLLNTLDDNQKGRDALLHFVEVILLKTRNYRGFRYLYEDDMEKSMLGTTVGMHSGKTGKDAFENTDYTRVRYL